MSGSRTAAEAALRPVAGVAEIQVVGALPDQVLRQMAWPVSNLSVWIHQSVVTHILERREAAPGDAEFVLEHMAAAVLRPHLFGPDLRDRRRVLVVRRVDGTHRCAAVCIKRVPAEEANSATDELWVSSGFPLGKRSLTKPKYCNTLQELVEEL